MPGPPRDGPIRQRRFQSRVDQVHLLLDVVPRNPDQHAEAGLLEALEQVLDDLPQVLHAKLGVEEHRRVDHSPELLRRLHENPVRLQRVVAQR